jgi:hypothetical protein
LLDSRQALPPETWARLAGHLNAEEIGEFLDRPIYAGGFNDMVNALLPGWTAKWVWIDEKETGSLFVEDFAWLVDDGRLGLDVGEVRIFFADDGRHFKDKAKGLPLPTLRGAAEVLRSNDVMGVELRALRDDVMLTRREIIEERSVVTQSRSFLPIQIALNTEYGR